jgi:hypothetical protein
MANHSPPKNPDAVFLTSSARTLVFLSVGVALIVLSVLLHSLNPTMEAILLKLGLVAVAVVVVDQLWRVCGGTPISRQITDLGKQVSRLSQSVDVIESSKNVGLLKVYDRLGNFGNQTEWIELITRARESVDLMGRTQFGWTRSKELREVIVEKITRDRVSLRWLLMSPRNPFLPMIEKTDVHSMLSRKLEIVLRFLREVHDSLPPDLKPRLQVRIFSHVPLSCSIMRVDSRFYVTQYLCNTSSDNSPFCCLKGPDGAWPKTYSQEFTSIWDESEDVFIEWPFPEAHSSAEQAPNAQQEPERDK